MRIAIFLVALALYTPNPTKQQNMKISKCTADINARKVSRNRIFLPTNLFVHWHYDSGKWIKIIK